MRKKTLFIVLCLLSGILTLGGCGKSETDDAKTQKSEAKEEEDNGLTEIIISKHTNGATGEVNLAFEKNFSRFTDLAPIGPDGSSAGVRDVRG